MAGRGIAAVKASLFSVEWTLCKAEGGTSGW